MRLQGRRLSRLQARNKTKHGLHCNFAMRDAFPSLCLKKLTDCRPVRRKCGFMSIKQIWIYAVALLLVASASAQTTVTTSGGTANSIPVFTGSSALGNSVITQENSNIGIGATNPQYKLSITGPSADTATGALMLTTPGVSSGERSSLSFFSTFANYPADTGPRRTADIIAGFASSSSDPGGGWGTEYMSFNVGDDGAANDNQAVTAEKVRIQSNGDVGIGTTTPSARLEVDGNLKLTSGSGSSITFADGTVQSTAYTGVACGGDYAEAVDVSGDRHHYGPGDLLVLDSDHPGNVLKSGAAYSTAIAGIYSTKPGYVGRRMTGPKRPNEVPMAMVGIVPTHVTTMNGSIHVGDLLVSSSIPGYAMKGTDRSRMLGAVVGKAMGNLTSGKGEIEVLVTLQ